MSLLDILPEPSFSHKIIPKRDNHSQNFVETNPSNSKILNTFSPPPYRHRNNFTPKTLSDFGQGGAFPEILVPQYPLGMGLNKQSVDVVPLQVGAKGEIKYDAVITQNNHKNAINSYKNNLNKPAKEESKRITEETRLALESVIETKIQANRPRQIVEDKTDIKEPVYIKLTTPSQTPQKIKTRARVVRLQTVISDPLEPPKYRFRKQPPRAPSPPAPVLQSPPRKLSRDEAVAWKIPPCVSNWKNVKSYTVPLDKRVAADGRNYESFTINSRFSSLSTALYEAENLARENVRLRGEQMHQIAKQKRLKKEKELEEQAREAMSESQSKTTQSLDNRKSENYNENLIAKKQTNSSNTSNESKIQTNKSPNEKPRYSTYSNKHKNVEKIENLTREQMESRRAREQLRRERLREQRRELRLEERRKKKGYAKRARERDIVERLALGESVAAGGETMYDSRLFNMQSGIASGLGDDEVGALYDKPLFDSVSSVAYRPRNNDKKGNDSPGEKRRKVRNETSKPIEFIENIPE